MSDVVPQLEEKKEKPAETETVRGRRTARLVGLLLIIIAVAAGWLLLVGYFGYQSGQQKLIENQQAEFSNQMTRQLTLAQENINNGNYELAIVRLQWILDHDQNNEQAQQLFAEAQRMMGQAAQATAVPTTAAAAAAAGPTPEPSPTPGQIGSPDEELQRIRRQIVRKEWDNVVASLITFQLQFPSYEREETDALLFDAYLGYSQQLLEGEQVELGLFYLKQAENLGNLPQTMLDYRTWAELYTQGISFYGANWDAAAYYFRDLCLAAPFYQDACTRLNEALEAHGDQYAGVQDWCPAQLLYQEARQQNNTAVLAEKVQLAREGCLAATPTPEGPITATVPFSGTLPGEPFVLPSPTP